MGGVDEAPGHRSASPAKDLRHLDDLAEAASAHLPPGKRSLQHEAVLPTPERPTESGQTVDTEEERAPVPTFARTGDHEAGPPDDKNDIRQTLSLYNKSLMCLAEEPEAEEHRRRLREAISRRTPEADTRLAQTQREQAATAVRAGWTAGSATWRRRQEYRELLNQMRPEANRELLELLSIEAGLQVPEAPEIPPDSDDSGAPGGFERRYGQRVRPSEEVQQRPGMPAASERWASAWTPSTVS